jgi:hypothetical protein
MAKADGTISTTDWIWLREALALAVAALGSVALAKKRLTEWLAAGKVPWVCMSWEGLDAEGVAKLKRESREGPLLLFPPRAGYYPSAAYYPGDPQFWSAGLKINWEDDEAHEPFVINGAQALGIKVSRAHVQALLPGVPRENKQVGPQMRRVLPVLKKLYPPHGKVPDDVPTEVVRARVNTELAADTRMQELAAPSWDTVNRALGRG